MNQITTHILDTANGKPAADVEVALLQFKQGDWQPLAQGATDGDGRIAEWSTSHIAAIAAGGKLTGGDYKLVFQTAAYFARINTPSFYPYVEIVFTIEGDGQHYHVPLLLNPYGYSTYRGS